MGRTNAEGEDEAAGSCAAGCCQAVVALLRRPAVEHALLERVSRCDFGRATPGDFGRATPVVVLRSV